MHIQIEIDETSLRELVLKYLEQKLGGIELDQDDVKIEVRSKQNYRAEWESAAFRARVDKFT